MSKRPRVSGQFVGDMFMMTGATPARSGDERKRVLAPVVPSAQPHCFQPRCSERAVVWTLDGNGACGFHANDLARRKHVEL